VSDEVAMREELHRRARHLDQLAQHDALTGLRNRRGVVPAAEELLAVASRDQVPVQLVFLDVDNLKRINDAHGHGVGDLVLTRVAEAIRRATRAPDVCARIGGDEFVVMLGNATAEEARQAVTRIEKQLAFEDTEPITRVSAGISSCEPDAQRSFDELVERADAEMLAAKARRRFGES
jgi:diguanylate cyclase (GGDEF)-like protein